MVLDTQDTVIDDRGFRPLTGMVHAMVFDANWNARFSPPYGDGTWSRSTAWSRSSFSPPYGDGTHRPHYHAIVYGFSPPYGDGTKSEDTLN